MPSNSHNNIFYRNYPQDLAKSLLYVISKTGNLLNPKNFRPIQVMKLLASLYDRILYNRIVLWINIQWEQSAYQNKKSTIIQLFTLRLLIELAIKI